MKKTLLITALLVFCTSILSAQVSKQVEKDAKREAKTFVKDGWMIAPGALPLQRQLEKAYTMQNEQNEDGTFKYYRGEGMSIGNTYDAAKMQALEVAKQNLASQMQSEIASLVDTKLANEQLAEEEAESIAKTVTASKTLITQSLSRIISVVEVYREKANKNKEVRVYIFHNAESAKAAAKKAIHKELEKESEEVADKLDEIVVW